MAPVQLRVSALRGLAVPLACVALTACALPVATPTPSTSLNAGPVPIATVRVVNVAPPTPAGTSTPAPTAVPTFLADQATRFAGIRITSTAESLERYGNPDRPLPAGQTILLPKTRWRVVSSQMSGGAAVVIVEVENLAASPRHVEPFELIDAQGRRFKTAFSARDIRDLPSVLSTSETLNPNVPARFAGVFPLPADATGLKAQLSDVEERRSVYVALAIPGR